MGDTQLFREQLKLENDTHTLALMRYDNEVLAKIKRGTIGDSREAIILIKASVDTVTAYIEEYYTMKGLKGTRKKIRAILLRYFERPQDLAYVATKLIISTLLLSPKIKALSASRAISRGLRDVIRAEALLTQNPSLFAKIENQHTTRSKGFINAKKIKVSKTFRMGEYSKDTILLLGLTIIDLVHKSGCNIIQMLNIGSTKYLSLSDEAGMMFSRSQEIFSKMLITYKPLICPPKNWFSISGTGGYYTYDNLNFIKLKNRRDYGLVMASRPNLERLFNVVNKLQQVPFRINSRILKTIEYIVKHNLVNPSSSIYNPVLYGDIPYMETMSLFKLISKNTYGELDGDNKFINHDDKIAWAKALDLQSKKIETITSKRISYRLGLNTAIEYKDREQFYFSYCLDFRSRLYPIQNFLTPQSPNNLKPLLEFAKGCKLNKEGVYWLKIQGANAYGYDKEKYEDRIRNIEEKIEEIKAVHKDPISNMRYWYEADKPLMYLAFCFAYGDYLEDPEIGCHIPVYLDATCSGIQIYSGLLKDYKGAMAVNVINNITGKPNDIYKDVSNKVEELILAGEYPKKITYTNKSKYVQVCDTSKEIRSIKGNMTRTLSKRNVMTTPYSVTSKGMFDQVLELLDDMEDNNKQFWKGEKWIVAKLISDLNAKAIALVVKGAITGQRIIKAVLKESLKTRNHCLWKTPIFGFPVLQRIKREKKRQLRSPLGKLVLYDLSRITHVQKMLNGIAPNFVHSLDATLLYRTVEICQEQDVNEFMLIHDDYGVLPNNVPIMNRAVRAGYVELFSGDPLEDWVNQIEPTAIEEAKEAIIGDLDLSEVLDSDYIFN